MGALGFIDARVSSMAAEAVAKESAPPSSEVRSAVQQIVQETYPYDPAVRQKLLAEKAPSSDLPTLEAVTVTESNNASGLRAHLEQKRRAAEAARPSLSRGASYTRNTTSIGVMSYEDRLPFGTPKPRWSLINLKF